MFIDFADVLLGLLLAALLVYLFWLWVQNGYELWNLWESGTMTFEQEKSLSWRLAPPKWIADTYLPIMFWTRYYRSKYDI